MENLKVLYDELNRIDKDQFRSKVIQKLFPAAAEASKRVDERLERHYETIFEKRGW